MASYGPTAGGEVLAAGGRQRSCRRRASPARRWAWLPVSLMLWLLVGITPLCAFAKGDHYADRIEARKLGGEGLKLYEAGEHEEALAKFEEANKLFPAPTLGLRAARCLVKLGRLVEASERYLDVSRFRLTRQSPRVHFVARREARAEREALLPQVPTLQVDVPDVDPDSVLLRIDGERLPSAMIGAPQPLDPGAHLVSLQRGTTEISARADLSSGEKTRLVMQLPGSAEVREVIAEEETSEHHRWGIISLAIGGGAAGLAAVNGVVTLALWKNLDDECQPDDTCPEALSSTNDIHKVTGAITTASMVLAGVALAAGTTLLLTDPGSEKLGPQVRSSSVRVVPFVGPGSVGLVGEF